jgi:23S rRNA (pseudouridine1915-N3)-methyltransferase
MTSERFAAWLGKALEARREVTFLLGGSEGLDPAVLALAEESLSLSPMTFTHEMARVILLEQIARAFSILKGTPYHR